MYQHYKHRQQGHSDTFDDDYDIKRGHLYVDSDTNLDTSNANLDTNSDTFNPNLDTQTQVCDSDTFTSPLTQTE